MDQLLRKLQWRRHSMSRRRHFLPTLSPTNHSRNKLPLKYAMKMFFVVNDDHNGQLLFKKGESRKRVLPFVLSSYWALLLPCHKKNAQFTVWVIGKCQMMTAKCRRHGNVTLPSHKFIHLSLPLCVCVCVCSSVLIQSFIITTSLQ